MIWAFALWFMLFVPTPLNSSSENVLDDWPYVIKKQPYPEQSPVDIPTKNAKSRFLPFLCYFGYWTLKKASIEIANNGHTVRVRLANNSDEVPYVTGGPLFNSNYEFEEMHFHWGENDLGSEHRVNGHQYAMEIHMVHYKKEYGNFKNAQNYIDGVCVIGFFGEISSKENEEMSNFIADLKHIIKPKSSIVRHFKEEFSWIQKTALKQQYFTYHGSLTTKPFLECVIWIIFTRPVMISRKQLAEFRKLHSSRQGMPIRENDRDLQSFNNRSIVKGY